MLQTALEGSGQRFAGVTLCTEVLIFWVNWGYAHQKMFLYFGNALVEAHWTQNVMLHQLLFTIFLVYGARWILLNIRILGNMLQICYICCKNWKKKWKKERLLSCICIMLSGIQFYIQYTLWGALVILCLYLQRKEEWNGSHFSLKNISSLFCCQIVRTVWMCITLWSPFQLTQTVGDSNFLCRNPTVPHLQP